VDEDEDDDGGGVGGVGGDDADRSPDATCRRGHHRCLWTDGNGRMASVGMALDGLHWTDGTRRRAASGRKDDSGWDGSVVLDIATDGSERSARGRKDGSNTFGRQAGRVTARGGVPCPGEGVAHRCAYPRGPQLSWPFWIGSFVCFVRSRTSVSAPCHAQRGGGGGVCLFVSIWFAMGASTYEACGMCSWGDGRNRSASDTDEPGLKEAVVANTSAVCTMTSPHVFGGG
jgi:hypothetical protein